MLKKTFLTITVFLIANLLLVSCVFASSEMWSQTYGGPEYDVASSLVETSDGGFLLAGYTDDEFGFYSDVLLVKTDAQGNTNWEQVYSRDDQDFAYSVVATPDGGFAVAGSSGSALDGRSAHFWLIKLDSDGNVVWNQTYVEGTARSLVVTSDG